MQNTTELYAKLQGRVATVIRETLSEAAMSVSSDGHTQTGNAYQSVLIDGQPVAGFRQAARDVLAGMALRGRSVADLGCNLGEIARMAARAGAGAVLGMEYDPLFVQVARYVAAHEELSNIQFKRADLLDPESYSGTFDIVLALSVWVYVGRHLDLLAGMVRETLIIETHSLGNDWVASYVWRLREHFPHIAAYAFSDHARGSASMPRLLIAASHIPLDDFLTARARNPATSTTFTIDVSASKVKQFDSFLTVTSLQQGASFECAVAAAKSLFAGCTVEQIAAAVAKDGLVETPEYWASFLLGWEEYRRSGLLSADNPYLQVTSALDVGAYDPALASIMRTESQLRERVIWRFDAAQRVVTPESFQGQEQLLLLNPVRPSPSWHFPWSLKLHQLSSPIHPVALDGHHRLFAAYLFSQKPLPCMPVWYSSGPVMDFLERAPEYQPRIWEGVLQIARELGAADSKPKDLAPIS